VSPAEAAARHLVIRVTLGGKLLHGKDLSHVCSPPFRVDRMVDRIRVAQIDHSVVLPFPQ
jgi:hypothetical protein